MKTAHICPFCGSKRLRKLTRMHFHYCPKCKTKFSIKEEQIVQCFRCDKDIINTDSEGELMGNGKYKCRRCRRVKVKEVSYIDKN